MRFLITTLAEYQTRFWLEVGLELSRQGHDTAFISFDDRSTEMLRAHRLQVFSATQGNKPDATLSQNEVDVVLHDFGVSNLNYWLGHERFAFGLRDSRKMRSKLASALLAADIACKEWAQGGSAVLVQELGGFLSVVGSYFAARKNGIDNWFLEPSFFRGRLFFLRNSFAALSVASPLSSSETPPPEVRQYLQETLSSRSIVIPIKDKHQYTTAWKKIVNTRNARRLMQKLLDKHLHGKTQEFGHIGNHVSRHASMLASSFKLRSWYTPLADCSPFVYYPLHVPGDMALTLRSPHLLDQLALIDYLCRATPATHRIAIKEHPAMVGALDANRMIDLLKRYDNLVLLPPATNNYSVLSSADAVVSVNSKSGAEAALLGKPVLVLGDAFYRESPLVTPISRLQDLPGALATCLASTEPTDPDLMLRYFAAVWAQSHPGELYVPDPTNVETFTASLVLATAPVAA